MIAARKNTRNITANDAALVIDSHKTVLEAIELMDRYHRHAIGVTVNGEFTGLFTRSDFMKRVIRHNLNPRKTPVGSVMTVDPLVISASSDLKESYYMMCYEGYSHLPVVENGQMVGILAEYDLRKDIASDLKKESRKNKVMEDMFREPYGRCADC